MMRVVLIWLSVLLGTFAGALAEAQPAPKPKAYPTPTEIVAAAPAADWTDIAPTDLLVMDLAPDAKGHARRVIIQLMPPPFSQGWVGNIRKLAQARWWDGLSINRVQDNYVTQWGDPNSDDPKLAKTLPDGLVRVSESDYGVERQGWMRLADPKTKLLIQFAADTGPTPDGSKFIDIHGNVVNATSERVSVPPLLINLKDENNKIVYTQNIILKYKNIEPNRSVPFEEIAAHLPNSAKYIEVKFLENHDFYDLNFDYYSKATGFGFGWPLAGQLDVQGIPRVYPTHCYGMVGVGRDLPPDTGTGAELYTVIGTPPRQLDRNIALVGRVVEGMEWLSSLPRGHGPLGFYDAAKGDERVPIVSVRLASELPAADQPHLQYLSTESASFFSYVDARANRRDPFYIRPAGGVDICNVPVPVRHKP